MHRYAYTHIHIHVYIETEKVICNFLMSALSVPDPFESEFVRNRYMIWIGIAADKI